MNGEMCMRVVINSLPCDSRGGPGQGCLCFSVQLNFLI